MKLTKTLMMAALMAGGLFANSALQAQDAPKDKPPGEQGGPGAPGGAVRRPGLSLETLSKQLDLTEDQKTKVKPVIDEMTQKMADLRKETSAAPTDRRTKMKEIRDAATAKLKDILTAEQFAKWEKSSSPARRPGAGGPPAGPGEGKKAKATEKN